MNDRTPLAQALTELNEQQAKSLVKQLIEEGTSANEILLQCQTGMSEMGKRFEEGDCFIPELIIAGKIMEEISNELEPLLLQDSLHKNTKGTVVLGTVQHDFHNIGKDIVAMILRGSGFEVIDLGVDVSPQSFVGAIEKHHAHVVGLSLLLTTGYPIVKSIVEAISKAGLRERVSIMVGGAASTQLLAEKTGCDFYGKTARDAVIHSESFCSA